MNRFAVHRGSLTHRSHVVPGFRLTDSTFPAGMTSTVHDHERPVLSVTLTGRFENQTAHEESDGAAATAFVKPAGEPHKNRVGTVHSRVLSIEPRDETLERLGRRRSVFESRGSVRDRRIGELAWRLAAELEEPDDLWAISAEGLVLETLAVAARSTAPPAGGRPAWLGRVLEILHERVAESFTIAEIAGEVGVGERELAERFRDHVHVPVATYARRLRLEKACQRLAGTADSITSVALGAGYTDQSHLTREMRKVLGTTPAAYRRSRA